jgi:hypothetical protein
MYCFCTYFDRNYLPRGLALYRSLREHCPEFRLWVLCMDEETHAALAQLDLPGVEPIALRAFEKGDDPLFDAKQNRSPIEYYFTCTPSLPLYVLNHWPEVDLITYLDADLFFFASPTPLFEELGGGSIAIIGHRFSPYMRKHEVYGIYNVGWLSFRRDENALACLNWWRAKCIEWCYDRLDNGRFADQKYLNDWPSRFQSVVVLEHKGANVALWNVSNYHLHSRDRDTVMVDEHPLIFFHFHYLKQITPWLYDPSWTAHGVTPSRVLRSRIYNSYLLCLDDLSRQLSSASRRRPGSLNLRDTMKQEGIQVSIVRRVLRRLLVMFFFGKDLLTGKYIVCVRFGQIRTPTTVLSKCEQLRFVRTHEGKRIGK